VPKGAARITDTEQSPGTKISHHPGGHAAPWSTALMNAPTGWFGSEDSLGSEELNRISYFF
jgi:hypothetical protein